MQVVRIPFGELVGNPAQRAKFAADHPNDGKQQDREADKPGKQGFFHQFKCCIISEFELLSDGNGEIFVGRRQPEDAPHIFFASDFLVNKS